MDDMLDTATSVTVIHGAMLSFETVEARDADDARRSACASSTRRCCA